VNNDCAPSTKLNYIYTRRHIYKDIGVVNNEYIKIYTGWINQSRSSNIDVNQSLSTVGMCMRKGTSYPREKL
jgi:hypothetical protein